jgi:hypothetical protein
MAGHWGAAGAPETRPMSADFASGAPVKCAALDSQEHKGNKWIPESRMSAMDQNKRNEWLRKLDQECPHQVVLPRRPLVEEFEMMRFLDYYVGKFDMYVEDECAQLVHYCFTDPADAAVFRSRFEQKSERFKLAANVLPNCRQPVPSPASSPAPVPWSNMTISNRCRGT